MRLKKYSSDLSERSWENIQPYIHIRRKSKWDMKDIVDGMMYVTKNGCVWRDLPADFPIWQTVYWYFNKWVKDGTLDAISNCLTMDYRLKRGLEAEPEIAIVDSQSTKNSITCTENVGIDGGKLVKGRKRFYFVDLLGNLLASFVVAANSYDGTTAARFWDALLLQSNLLDRIKTIFADGTFGGTFTDLMKKQYDIEVTIPKIPIAQKGKVTIHEKRWIVERTIAWTLNNRRCSKDYERKTVNANAFLVLANIRRVVRLI